MQVEIGIYRVSVATFARGGGGAAFPGAEVGAPLRRSKPF